MNTYRSLAIVISVIILTGCGADDKKNAADINETSKFVIPATTTEALPTDSNKNTATITTDAQSVSTSAPTPAGLNPAHGQPGHRCDIEVGAPFDSKPVKPDNTTQPSTSINTNAAGSTPSNLDVTATPVTKGINPSHGQPGHRCDIAVGAALDSKPAPAVSTSPAITTTTRDTTPKSAFNPLPVTPIIPVNNNSTVTNTTVATGINPAHGQPGHRCDIAVGAPLNSKQKQ